MNLQEYQQMAAELMAIDSLLERIPSSRMIERIGLESRRNEIDAAMATQPVPEREPVRAKLTFRGKPVMGSHGIIAEFGTSVTKAFAEAVAAMGASVDRALGTRGVLPNRGEFQMMITGTATGSFGFQLEEAAQGELSLFTKKSALETAIEQTQAVMRATLGSDDELTEAISETDQRAIDAVRKFLDEMAKNGAACTLEFGDSILRFADAGQVGRCSERLTLDNIQENEQVLEGIFNGALPTHRTFEFRLQNSDEIVFGKIGGTIDSPHEINQHLGTPMTITVRRRQVGAGKPSYVLLGYAAVSGENEQSGNARGTEE